MHMLKIYFYVSSVNNYFLFALMDNKKEVYLSNIKKKRMSEGKKQGRKNAGNKFCPSVTEPRIGVGFSDVAGYIRWFYRQ